jgi:pSer/pThr/pTyr-binding forkhead associated (FHA) protein
MLSGGGIRTNDIAIDDDPSSPQFENNGYVSRAHAYITYYEQFGFLLTVELDGTTAKGHRTDIDRGGQIVRLTNPNAPEVLQYGDCIVLSKKVRLMFEKE